MARWFFATLACSHVWASNFTRLCTRDAAFDEKRFPSLTSDQAEVAHIKSRGGATINYAFTKPRMPGGCLTVVAPGLSSFAAPFAEWLYPLAQRTTCEVAVLEYRGFGLSEQPGQDKFGMKIATIASDYNDLIRHVATGYADVFLLGLSMGANIIWAYLQLYHTEGINLRGLLPLDGGLLATPQARGAAISFKPGAAFTWSAMETMTNNFLEADTWEKCFEVEYGFFSMPGFFGTPELRDYYMRFMCRVDCVSMGLLNKDSLLADYTDAVLENKRVHRIPTFIYQPEGSILPESIQEFIAEHTMEIAGSVRLKLSAKDGGDHFALVPGAPGNKVLMDELVSFLKTHTTARTNHDDL